MVGLQDTTGLPGALTLSSVLRLEVVVDTTRYSGCGPTLPVPVYLLDAVMPGCRDRPRLRTNPRCLTLHNTSLDIVSRGRGGRAVYRYKLQR